MRIQPKSSEKNNKYSKEPHSPENLNSIIPFILGYRYVHLFQLLEGDVWVYDRQALMKVLIHDRLMCLFNPIHLKYDPN